MGGEARRGVMCGVDSRRLLARSVALTTRRVAGRHFLGAHRRHFVGPAMLNLSYLLIVLPRQVR